MNIDPGKREATVQIRNSAMTRGIDKGIGCDFIRGYLSGIYDIVFETHTLCQEVKCESKADQFCEFRVSPA